jgi:hypothetical protein
MPVRSLTDVISPEFYAEYGGIDTMTSTPLGLSFVDYRPSHSPRDAKSLYVRLLIFRQLREVEPRMDSPQQQSPETLSATAASPHPGPVSAYSLLALGRQLGRDTPLKLAIATALLRTAPGLLVML